jgi:hypothetical protein
MSTEKFICYPCGRSWRDTYSVWRGYLSRCPGCGRACQAFCDTEVFADQQEMEGLLIDGPPLDPDIESDGLTEADLEGERDQIRDEICEALGAVESETSDTDEDSDSDEDADGDADGSDSGDGF